ncbi:guanylate kinase [Secundilactobacillus oryzae JCM 18671]|uniref:Guanylate kinase n=1 Tax=Secundilactobacillus oryzae JCM 18671 TaxID=1291743 RepID=A0A081BHZ6_9LACO|nr:AAA family ATPase [Secundilactobacillus oryzae]GAK47664.1 guanylate kinase [Secundilactobacillus oryzae JCM 18671]
MHNRIIVITGATGTGKTTVSEYLREAYQVPRVITHTTRVPRVGEVDGVDYYFETDDTFAKRHFLESVIYDGHQYGSSYEALERGWANSPFLSIVLDTQGAITYAEKLGDQAVIIFLTVSQGQTLQQRITERGDDPNAIDHRLESDEYRRDLELPAELQGKAKVVLNDHLAEAKKALDGIMASLQVNAE